jgi:hypothetical protein
MPVLLSQDRTQHAEYSKKDEDRNDKLMKALSLNPPYATLIAACQRFPELGKHIETRGWSTNYRGDLLIHQTAGLGTMFADEAELATFCAAEPFRSTLAALGFTEAAQLPRGLIIAKVNLVTSSRPISCPSAGAVAARPGGLRTRSAPSVTIRRTARLAAGRCATAGHVDPDERTAGPLGL